MGLLKDKMNTIELLEDDEPDPSKLGSLARKRLHDFKEGAIMLSALKRMVLRKKLKKEKRDILLSLMEVNRKLKILDGIDAKEKKEKEDL